MKLVMRMKFVATSILLACVVGGGLACQSVTLRQLDSSQARSLQALRQSDAGEDQDETEARWLSAYRQANGPEGAGQQRALDGEVRAYFAALSGEARKLAAIEMTDSRYVYAIPTRLMPELLGPLLGDDSVEVRLAALASAAYNNCAVELAENLEGFTSSDDARERGASLWAMGRTGAPQFAEAIQRGWTDQDPSVRAQALRSWGAWTHSSHEGLWDKLNDEAPRVLVETIRLLHQHGDGKRLEKALEIQLLDPQRRELVRQALDDAREGGHIPPSALERLFD